MRYRFERWLGLDATSPYVGHYFEASNARASIYMSLIVMLIEIWMIVDLARTKTSEVITTAGYPILNWFFYILLFASAIVVLFNADKYFLNGEKYVPFGKIILGLFVVICSAFGIYTAYCNFMNGEQILSFFVMELLVVCLLAWKPYISFFILLLSSSTLYLLMDYYSPISAKMSAYYMIMTIAIFFTSFSTFSQKRAEAEKDERLESTYTQLTNIATVDELTGIPNMNYFRENVRTILDSGRRNPKKMIFLFLDVENFKALNEKYGFESGNAFLAKFGNQISEIFNDSLLARQGDDHFVIFTDRSTFMDRLSKLRSILYDYHTETLIGIKAGGYVPEDSSCDVNLAIDRARYACSSIKKHYDQDYREYDSALNSEFEMRQYIVNNIDAALDKGEIKVYYQPVMWSRNYKLCGYEALTKWEDPKYGLLQPGVYIPVLEEYRQVHKIDMIVCETVCRDIRNLMDKHRPAVPVSLNFSRLDFELTDVTDILETFTQKYNVPRSFLHVEVTESALSGELTELKAELDEMKELGYPLWLDDFGSGYSSLNVLKDFSFDVMKIDMKFLSSFDQNPEKSKLVLRNVCALSNDLGMRSLCEGVETREQADYLKSIGCERLQGYYFGKAMVLDDIMVKIKAGTIPVSEEFIVKAFSGT